jgi:cytochrome c-type biogenesis protein CcmF
MNATLGYLSILAAVVGALGTTVRGFIAMRDPERANKGYLGLPVILFVSGAVGAMFFLELGLLTDDFSIKYIANNSSTTTPFLFKVASGWASLEGSIVLWGLVLAGFTFAVYARFFRSESGDRLAAGALAIMGLISLYFFGLMATISDPFARCVQTFSDGVGCVTGENAILANVISSPIEGRGANALLQNHWLMALHPPTLYVGYVGLSVPFAFAISALLLRTTGAAWLTRTRNWTVFAWMFLTAGIVLGGLWSYEVLGWGGYWAWDPVENASFMPWLVATAFLHSSVVQARRGMLQSWNFVLVITTFALTILGTFLTRSGVIVSVHSFSQSAIGPALLIFLVVVLLGSLGLFASRAHTIASSPRLDSLSSREGVFLFNNLLLTVFAFMVLTGTLYPLFVEAFSESTVGVGRPFFDRMAIPLSFLLLLAMGIGPVSPYRAASARVVWERIRWPVRVALGAAALAVVFGYRNSFLLLGVLAAVFVMGVIIRNLYDAARTRADKLGIERRQAAVRIMRGDPHYWGGQISHLGVAILALGIAFSANLSETATVTIDAGDTVNFAGFEVTYQREFSRQEPGRFVTGADITVTRDGSVVGTYQPRLNQYGNTRESIATPEVDTMFSGDLYLSLRSIDPRSVTLEVYWFPFIWLIWVGGFLAAAAGVWGFAVKKPARSVVRDETRV